MNPGSGMIVMVVLRFEEHQMRAKDNAKVLKKDILGFRSELG